MVSDFQGAGTLQKGGSYSPQQTFLPFVVSTICDGNLYQVPRWMEILKPSEKDFNDVTVIQMEFPGGWKFAILTERVEGKPAGG